MLSKSGNYQHCVRFYSLGRSSFHWGTLYLLLFVTNHIQYKKKKRYLHIHWILFKPPEVPSQKNKERKQMSSTQCFVLADFCSPLPCLIHMFVLIILNCQCIVYYCDEKFSTMFLADFCPHPPRLIHMFVLIIPFPSEKPVGKHPGDTVYAYCTCIFGEK